MAVVFRGLAIVDHYTRECPVIEVDLGRASCVYSSNLRRNLDCSLLQSPAILHCARLVLPVERRSNPLTHAAHILAIARRSLRTETTMTRKTWRCEERKGQHTLNRIRCEKLANGDLEENFLEPDADRRAAVVI